MIPFSLYHLHREAFTSLQPALTGVITGAAATDFIFLLGASVQQRRSESIFAPASPTAHYIAHCTLLVLLQDEAGKELHQWQDKIETRCSAALLPVTALVLSTTRFMAWLQAGHPFALKVQQWAAVLYDGGKVALPLQAQDALPAFPDKQAQKEGAARLVQAGEFMAGAELFRLREQYSMAAFMLHQSAEHTLGALVKLGMGYAPNTHSIERLLRYATLVDGRVADVFGTGSERDKRLLRLLQKAYIDARYEDYTISKEDLDGLAKKVTRLHHLLEQFIKAHTSTAQT